MPSVLIEPEISLLTKLSDIPVSRKIPNFSSRLFFFDYFLLGAERFPSAYGREAEVRNLFEGEQSRFLEKNQIGFRFSNLGEVDFASSALNAKEEFQEGRFKPERPRDIDVLSKIAERDVFVSDRLMKMTSNEYPVISLEFVDGMPIPPRNWKPEKIFKFKRKNHSKYMAFWQALDTLASDAVFLNDPDPQHLVRRGILDGLGELAAASTDTFGNRLRDATTFQFTPARTGSFASLATALYTQPYIEFSTAFPVFLGALGIVNITYKMSRSHPPLSQSARGMTYLSNIRTSPPS